MEVHHSLLGQIRGNQNSGLLNLLKGKAPKCPHPLKEYQCGIRVRFSQCGQPAAAAVLNGGIFYGTYREAHVYFINGMPQLSGTPNWYRKCYSEEEARNELRSNGFAATADSVEVIDIGGLNAIVRPPKSARSR